jgi:DNA-binding transcriptional MerR regulator
VPDPLTEIPDRAAFKAAEVCEIAQIPPYVLRSWEKEFPGLGVAARAGGPKVYRRADVEQVLKIKHLLFSEGLTLAGARRKLEGEPPPEAETEAALPVPDEVRTKVATLKRELRSLLDLLSAGPPSGGLAESPAAPILAAPRSGPRAGATEQVPGPAAAEPADAPPAAVPQMPPGTWPPGPAVPGAAGPAPVGTRAVEAPPVAPAAASPAPAPRDADASLPLLDGTPETPAVPARSRRAKRPAKG